MNLTEARAAAVDFLRSVETTGEPLRLAESDEQVADVRWAWVFAWSTSEWFDTGEGRPPVGAGPIVVVKESGDTWMLDSATPYDDELAAYAADHGLEHTTSLEAADPAAVLAAWLTGHSHRPDPVTVTELASWRCREVGDWWLFEMPGLSDTMFLVRDAVVYEFHPSSRSVDEALAAAGGVG